MSELVDNSTFTSIEQSSPLDILLPDMETLMEQDTIVDRQIQPVVVPIEHTYSPKILALEKAMQQYPEAFALYQQIDLLIAEEKGLIQRACYRAGLVYATNWL